MIHRSEHYKEFLRVDWSVIRDSNLSFEARGFLVFMLSMSDDWEFSIMGLSALTGLSKNVVMRLVKELKDNGYITQKKKHDKAGHFNSYEWHIYEITEVDKNRSSEITELGENRTTAQPKSGSTEVRKTSTYKNDNNISNENLISNENRVSRETYGEFQNVKLSRDEFSKLGERIGQEMRDGLIEELSCYLIDHPRKYKSHYSALLTWARRRKSEQKTRPKPQPISENPFTVLRREEGYE